MSKFPAPPLTRVPISDGKCLVYGAEAELCAWASERIGQGDLWPADTVTIGLEQNGRTIAVGLFNRFDGSDCHMHIATDGRKNWASRGVLAAVFSFPFIQVGCRRITAPVASRNTASLVAAIKLGFVPEGLMARALPNDDVARLVMFKERCPWLPRMEA